MGWKRVQSRALEIAKEEGYASLMKNLSYYSYAKSRRITKLLLYGYHYNNFIERRNNKELLKKARSNLGTKINCKDPLISVLIPTYNRGKILVERTIPSILRQTWQNFEIIVVGDHCPDNTEELVNELGDKRIKFYNLPERGKYPPKPENRWMVAGTIPRNKAIELCSGDWIAPLDDDDEFSEDHLEVLLSYALEHNYEMVYGKILMEIKPNKWAEVGSCPLELAQICHPSVLYHSMLKFLKYDINSWKYDEPGDWNMWRRMKESGVRIGFVDKIVGKHYLEKAWSNLK